MLRFSRRSLFIVTIFLITVFVLSSSVLAAPAAPKASISDAYQEGYQHGVKNKEKIEKAVEKLITRLKDEGYDIQKMNEKAKKNEQIYKEVIPEKFQWMKGVADATGIPYLKILLLNSFARDDCTTFVAHGKATKDGGTIIGKNRDLGAKDLNCVEVHEHRYPQESMYRAAYIDIPQVKETYKFIGVKSVGRWGFGMGINEFQVSVSDNDMASMDELSYQEGLHDNDYIRIALERARTAREAVDVIAELTEKYGQAWNGIAFLIGDPEEVWVMEVAGYRWVAKRYENTVTARANQFQIGYDYDLASEDLVSYAIEQGWITKDDVKDGKIDFKKVYGAKEHYPAPDEEKVHQWPLYTSQIRYERAMELLNSKKGSITVQDIMKFQQDHYDEVKLQNGEVINMEQTPYFSSKWFLKVNYPRQICHHGVSGKTVASTVIVSKPHTFNELGVMWTQLGQPCESTYVPFYVGITSIPKAYATAEAPVKFESIRSRAFGSYQSLHPVIREVFEPFEKENFKKAEEIEKQARLELMKGNADVAKEILTKFTHERAIKALELVDVIQNRMTQKVVERQSWSR